MCPKRAQIQQANNTNPIDCCKREKFPCEIPPQSCLQSWKKELTEFNKIHPDKSAYMQCQMKTEMKYDVQMINELLQVHKAMEIKQEVSRELDWFADATNCPTDVVSQPDQKHIRNFQSLIYSKRYDEILSGYDASAEELSRLCCTRWLSGDHMSWITQKINSMQEETFCIYLNFIRETDRFVTKRIQPLQQKPTKFLFLINVGKSRDGNVHFGSNQQPGNHWTTCHVDTRERVVTYCDSLAWPSPVNLLERIGEFIQTTHNEAVSLYSFVYAHDPSSTGPQGHQCLSSCASLYPLQRCGNVCGVVVIIVAAIACLANDLFRQLTKKIDNAPQCSIFLSDPTKYSKYLRLVLISWFGAKSVSLSNILPLFDTDVEVPFKQQTDTKSFNSKNDEKKEEKKTGVQKQKTEQTEMKKEKEEVKRNTFLNSFKSPLSKVPKALQTKKGVQKWECRYCDLTCNDKSNLNSHIRRKHKEVNIKEVGSGGRCTCLQCGYSCHRITEFREHLSMAHNVIFRTENIKLQNYQGV